MILDIRKYKLGEGELLYIPHWADDPDMVYREAKKLLFTPEYVPSRKDPKVPVQIKERQTVNFGLSYKYNEFAKPSIDWAPLALAIKQKLESQLGRALLQCACNSYPNASAYIGAHCDKNTPVSGVSTAPNLIVSLSLGCTRQMALRPIRLGHEAEASALITMSEVRKEKDVIVLDLEPGSLVIFDGVLNHSWKHAIPQAENKKAAGERISLTYREF
jgi:alkylated DNA repair dioxygenase AlkB